MEKIQPLCSQALACVYLRLDQAPELLESFPKASELGSVDIETEIDPSGLYWVPRSSQDSWALFSALHNMPIGWRMNLLVR